MKYRKLGTTNVNVSVICLGTMTWGEQNTEKEAFEQMDYAVEKGVNFFDTAEIYAVPTKKKLMDLQKNILVTGFMKENAEIKLFLLLK